MKKTVFNFTALALTAAFVLTTACQKEEFETIAEQPDLLEESLSRPASPEIIDLLSCHGFQTEGAVEQGDYVTVEDDILIHKDAINALLEASAARHGSEVESRQHALNEGTLVNVSNASAIKIYIHSGISQIPMQGADWQTAIITALADWITISNCRVHFTFVSEHSQANLSFFADNNTTLPSGMRNLSSTTYARACFPSSGQVGRYISINDGVSATLDQKKKIIRHEVGHTLGLRHNNPTGETASGNNACGGTYNGLNLIQGTLQNDPQSVMTSDFNYYIFSDNDKKAARFLYPETYNTPTINSWLINTCGPCGTGSRQVKLTTNTPTQEPYRVVVERYTLTGSTPTQTYTFQNPGTSTSFQFLCPTGTWRFKVSKRNYGVYKADSSFKTITVI